MNIRRLTPQELEERLGCTWEEAQDVLSDQADRARQDEQDRELENED